MESNYEREHMAGSDYIMRNQNKELTIPSGTLLYRIPIMIMDRFYNRNRIGDYDIQFEIGNIMLSIYTLDLNSRIGEHHPRKINVKIFQTANERTIKLRQLLDIYDNIEPHISGQIYKMLFDQWIGPQEMDGYMLEHINNIMSTTHRVPPVSAMSLTRGSEDVPQRRPVNAQTSQQVRAAVHGLLGYGSPESQMAGAAGIYDLLQLGQQSRQQSRQALLPSSTIGTLPHVRSTQLQAARLQHGATSFQPKEQRHSEGITRY